VDSKSVWGREPSRKGITNTFSDKVGGVAGLVQSLPSRGRSGDRFGQRAIARRLKAKKEQGSGNNKPLTEGKLCLPLKIRLSTSGIRGCGELPVGLIDEPAAADWCELDRKPVLEMSEVRLDEVVRLTGLDPKQFSLAVELPNIPIVDCGELPLHPEKKEVERLGLITKTSSVRAVASCIRAPRVMIELSSVQILT
jgi:hypothetical protein